MTKNDLGVDAVSRQAVLDLMIQKWGENFSGDSAMQESIDAIRVLPSVTPQEPKTGHWIDCKDWYECSECGESHSYCHKYCPYCGAKMVEPQESEDRNKIDLRLFEQKKKKIVSTKDALEDIIPYSTKRGKGEG